jgi:hypothetical protein
MCETVYVVERHDDGYHGPNVSRIAKDADAAMAVAEQMREDHRGDDWSMRTSERDGRARVAFHSAGARGWVSVTEKPLVE